MDRPPCDGSRVEDISRKCSLRKNETRPIREPQSSAAFRRFAQKTTLSQWDDRVYGSTTTQIYWTFNMQGWNTHWCVRITERAWKRGESFSVRGTLSIVRKSLCCAEAPGKCYNPLNSETWALKPHLFIPAGEHAWSSATVQTFVTS